MKIAIIDYGAGNIRSLQFALERLGVVGELTSDPELITKADKVIFPGQGAAKSAMLKLKAHGLDLFNPPIKATCIGDLFGDAIVM